MVYVIISKGGNFMKLLLNSYCKSEVAPGNYEFVIVSANVITCNNQLQVAFRLGKEDDD